MKKVWPADTVALMIASCGVGPICVFFNEPKQHFTCSMYPLYMTHGTGWWFLNNTDAHANECVLKAF